MAWELGANMGHIDRMLVTARALREHGHDVMFALKDLSRAHDRVVAEGFAVMQSPLWLPRMVKQPSLANYSTVLAAAGWLDARGLAGLVSAWRTAFRLFRPDLVVCDHAPTAMLAARGQGIALAAIGNSFHVPPVGDVFPAFRYWDAVERARCPAGDAVVLRHANEALAALGDAPLPRLTALFSEARCIAASLPELRHYPDYPASVAMVGPTFVGDSGIAPQWPAGDGPKVFVYLSPEHADFAPLLAALRDSGAVVLAHARGLSADKVARLGGPRIRFEASPLRVTPTVRQAQLVVTHASIGTVSAALLAGCVQLVLPNHMEQYMVARRVADAGIGLVVEPGSQGSDYAALLRRLVGEPAFAQAAQALARRHEGVSPAGTGMQIFAALAPLLA